MEAREIEKYPKQILVTVENSDELEKLTELCDGSLEHVEAEIAFPNGKEIEVPSPAPPEKEKRHYKKREPKKPEQELVGVKLRNKDRKKLPIAAAAKRERIERAKELVRNGMEPLKAYKKVWGEGRVSGRVLGELNKETGKEGRPPEETASTVATPRHMTRKERDVRKEKKNGKTADAFKIAAGFLEDKKGNADGFALGSLQEHLQMNGIPDYEIGKISSAMTDAGSDFMRMLWHDHSVKISTFRGENGKMFLAEEAS
ncbi:MAG: hypothetical protein NTU57_02570 [Candidatus Aenigmarchaeota archaeon]|nr:hypothetical protein [Candidatus Aenigmarchaeota archaeon]